MSNGMTQHMAVPYVEFITAHMYKDNYDRSLLSKLAKEIFEKTWWKLTKSKISLLGTWPCHAEWIQTWEVCSNMYDWYFVEIFLKRGDWFIICQIFLVES